jgi:OOP family OmpA-OmpF porin
MLKKSLKTFVASFGTVALLGACTAGYNITDAKYHKPEGDDFGSALHKKYTGIAKFEQGSEGNHVDAEYMAKKAMMASAGDMVLPEDPAQWKIGAEHLDEMVAGRNKLVKLLDMGGREKFPLLSARAQTKFDCWVEQQEEGFQKIHIEKCRKDFYAALNELEKALNPKAYVILFGLDSTYLTRAAKEQIEKVKAEYFADPTVKVSLVGHADRSGSDDYNLGLSKRRAEAVKRELMKCGVPAANVVMDYKGETQPAVPTKDGVVEKRNRRVEVVIR